MLQFIHQMTLMHICLFFLYKIIYLFIYLYVGFKFSVVVVFGVVVDEGSTP